MGYIEVALKLNKNTKVNKPNVLEIGDQHKMNKA